MNNHEQLTREGKIMMLAYDQGLEHGPTDFNDKNYHPDYILEMARNGGYTCVALQYGTAYKFWRDRYEDIPLVLKLNGKTNLGTERISVAQSTVQEALQLGAKAVGYTIYLGSDREAEIIREFSQIRREAHENGLAVFAWMYPFMTLPSSNDDEREADIVAYAARAGAELGADVVKIKFPHKGEKLDWIIKNAVGTKAVLSGGDKASDEEFLGTVRAFMDAGGDGLAVGRNAWQHDDPLELAKKLRGIIFPG
jgi:class I fructose-bisphosphate aldolase